MTISGAPVTSPGAATPIEPAWMGRLRTGIRIGCVIVGSTAAAMGVATLHRPWAPMLDEEGLFWVGAVAMFLPVALLLGAAAADSTALPDAFHHLVSGFGWLDTANGGDGHVLTASATEGPLRRHVLSKGWGTVLLQVVAVALIVLAFALGNAGEANGGHYCLLENHWCKRVSKAEYEEALAWNALFLVGAILFLTELGHRITPRWIARPDPYRYLPPPPPSTRST